MWALVPRKTQILLIAGLAIVLAWGMEALWKIIQGTTSSPLKSISLVAMLISTVLAGIVSATWRYVWARFPWIGRQTFPDLTGTWEGHLISTWINPDTRQRLPPIPTTIWIRQGLFATSIKVRTDESMSYSKRCWLETDPEAGRFRCWYAYDNDPKAAFRFRSARHEGVAWLEMDMDANPERLLGYYYTERKTSGDMDVGRTSRAIDASLS